MKGASFQIKHKPHSLTKMNMRKIGNCQCKELRKEAKV